MTDLATRQAWLQNLMRSRWTEINDAAVIEWRAQILSNVAAIGHHTAVFTQFMEGLSGFPIPLLIADGLCDLLQQRDHGF